MSRVGKYTLAYLGTAGLTVLIVAGLLLIALVDRYNDTRRVDVPLASLTLVAYTMAQALLAAAVAAYAAARSSYETPPIPELPPARTVALIPAYKEEGRVGEVVRKARRYVDLVIVVDDGSSDATAREAEEAGAIVIKHPRNMGKGFAVRTLVKAALKAGAQYAVMLDADGQHDPGDIPRFLEPLTKGEADHAVANRFGATKMPLIRRIGYKLLALEHALLVRPLPDPFNGYRGFTRRALELLDRSFDPSYGVEVARVAALFSASRYIRLAYTALALTLPTLASTLTAAAAATSITSNAPA